MATAVVRIECGKDIPASFGRPRKAVRRSCVSIREPKSVETFELSWGSLTATPGVDLVVVQDSGEEYPIKIDVFEATYQQVAPGRFRKSAVSRLVQVPPGVLAVLVTREGELKVAHPDYVVIGADDEVYANDPEWVAANLEFIDEPS